MKNQTINCRGKLIDLSKPRVMGILNVTPDSFFDGGRYNEASALIDQAQKHLDEGAEILDVGAVSTRPNATEVSEDEEERRLIPAIKLLRTSFPDVIISVDTFRASIAEKAVNAGADMINDISGGTMDDRMFETIAKLNVPYILMHIQGTPATMQKSPSYANVVQEVFDALLETVHALRRLGVKDLIIDPGFGFGKTVEHNFALLKELNQFTRLDCPVLVGFSRKSMINKVLGTTPSEALNGTTVLNTLALEKGATILRVHDAKPAKEAVLLWQQLSD